MRRQRGLIGLMGLAALVGLGFTARPAAARVTTEQSASILVFPKVIADGTRDTIIQITNTSNNMRHAHCFYVNGALTDNTAPPGPLNPPLCTEIDFDIWLTKQQPTHWVVSTGRLDNPLDKPCRVAGKLANCDPDSTGSDSADCCDAGYDPGHVPPVVPDFQGELKCIEVDASGFPVPGNALKGEATLENLADGDVSKYNAIGLKGFDTNNMDGTLCLGGGVSASCPSGAEYEACPAAWILDHPSDGATDPVVTEQSFCTEPDGDTINSCTSSVDTSLTVVPCTENFETQSPQPITLQFAITNEFEQTFSASTTFACWASFDLEDINSIFQVDNVGGNILQTRMRSAGGTPFGVMAVLEETHSDSFTISSTTHSFVARSAQNAHTTFQDQVGPDIITIPADQIQGQ
jgi:hypothetical protein